MTDNNWHNKRVLITGATGFVGSNATKYFYNLGCKVTSAILTGTKTEVIKRQLLGSEERINLIECNLELPGDALKISKDQDVILNFAAVDGNIQYKSTHSAEILSKNIRINLNILDAARGNNIKDILLVSSSDIYSATNNEIINEDSPIETNWKERMDGYKFAKWVSEIMSGEYAKQYGLKITIVRPSNIYGPGDDFEGKEKMRFIPTIIKNIVSDNKPVVIWGDGTQIRSYIYVNDFLDICRRLIECKVYNQPINVASYNHTKIIELPKLVAKLNSKKVNIITDKTKPAGPHSRIFDITKLTNTIGEYQETPLEEGLKSTIDFFKKNYS